MSNMRTFWNQLRSNRKKVGMICALFALAMLFWARLIVIADMPRTAIAEPPTADGPAARDQAERETSHNDEDADATPHDETQDRDATAAQRPRSATTQRSVAE